MANGKMTTKTAASSKSGKKKKPTLGQIKRKTWAMFSLYIRTRDALRTTGTTEYALCITCDRKYPLKAVGGLQAGHFITGRHNSVLFDERNVHAQCYGCNVGKKGNMVVYYKKMLEMYGQDVIDELEQLDKVNRQYKVWELLDLYNELNLKLESLINPKHTP